MRTWSGRCSKSLAVRQGEKVAMGSRTVDAAGPGVRGSSTAAVFYSMIHSCATSFNNRVLQQKPQCCTGSAVLDSA